MLALLYAFATSPTAWVGAPWQHTPSMLLLTIAMYLLLRGRAAIASRLGWTPGRAVLHRAAHESLAVLIFTAYVAVRFALIFFDISSPRPRSRLASWPTTIRSITILSPYYHTHLEGFGRVKLVPRRRVGLAGNLVSPSRGLLIFTPGVPVCGMEHGTREMDDSSVTLAGGLGSAALACISSYIASWWAGHSYGPRFLHRPHPCFRPFFSYPHSRDGVAFAYFRTAFVGCSRWSAWRSICAEAGRSRCVNGTSIRSISISTRSATGIGRIPSSCDEFKPRALRRTTPPCQNGQFRQAL